MKADGLRKTLKRHDALRRQLEPLSAHIEALQLDFRGALIDEANLASNLTRAALGPIEDLRRSLQLDAVPNIANELESMRSLSVALEKQFRLPTVVETPALLRTLEIDASARVLAHYRDHESELRQAIEAMSAPWLKLQDQTRSLTGIVELQEIGHVLRTMPDFGIQSADRLRPHLGDWRASIDWPPEIFSDPLARSDFYVERGLDPALTDFPANAFDQAITIAGIKRPPPPRIGDYDHAPDPSYDDEEAGLQRNNAAYDRLQRFETHVRRFIDRMMTAALGTNWIKHRVAGPIRQEWRDKRNKALASGEPEKPLIAYADFTDYEAIIVRNDNWREVFRSVFQRKTLVHESFRRLYPIRVCTMHSRIITQDDELYLHAETRRLLLAIGIKT